MQILQDSGKKNWKKYAFLWKISSKILDFFITRVNLSPALFQITIQPNELSLFGINQSTFEKGVALAIRGNTRKALYSDN